MSIEALQSLKEAVITELKEKGYSKIGKYGLRIKFAEILQMPEKSSFILNLVNKFMEEENIKMVGNSLEGDCEYLYFGNLHFNSVSKLKEYYRIK